MNTEQYTMRIEDVPFFKDGVMKCPVRPTGLKVFIYERPKLEKFEGTELFIPEDHQEFYRHAEGYVVAIGKGYYKDDGEYVDNSDKIKVGTHVLFDGDVPWKRMEAIDSNGNVHELRWMGTYDIKAIVEE